MKKRVFKELCRKVHLPTDLTKLIGARFTFSPTKLPKPECYAGEIFGIELYNENCLLLYVKVHGTTKHEVDKVKHAILFDPVTKQWYWQMFTRHKVLPIDFPGHTGQNYGHLEVSWPR